MKLLMTYIKINLDILTLKVGLSRISGKAGICDVLIIVYLVNAGYPAEYLVSDLTPI